MHGRTLSDERKEERGMGGNTQTERENAKKERAKGSSVGADNMFCYVTLCYVL